MLRKVDFALEIDENVQTVVKFSSSLFVQRDLRYVFYCARLFLRKNSFCTKIKLTLVETSGCKDLLFVSVAV